MATRNKPLTSREETDLRMRQTQIASQSKLFYNIWSEYQVSQSEYREQSKKFLVKQCKVMGTSGLSDEELETMIDDGKNPFATSLFDQERMAKEKLLDIQLRH